jgi:hypothetical protein
MKHTKNAKSGLVASKYIKHPTICLYLVASTTFSFSSLAASAKDGMVLNGIPSGYRSKQFIVFYPMLLEYPLATNLALYFSVSPLSL